MDMSPHRPVRSAGTRTVPGRSSWLRSGLVLALLGAGMTFETLSCSAGAPGNVDATGGTAVPGGGSGGAPSGSGGLAGSSGVAGSGGRQATTGTGGDVGSGGALGSGGTPGSGGRVASGGAPGSGGIGTVGSGGAPAPMGSGGHASGGSASGGSAAGGQPAGTGGKGSGGAGAGGAASGGTTGAGTVYGQCRFHFGTIDTIAKSNPSMIAQLDFFTPGWMGQQDTFDMQYVCDETKSGAAFAAQVPAIVAYVAAFYAKRHDNLKDCNASGAQQDLCTVGAGFISDNLAKIVATYESYAAGFAACYGTTRPIIFMMEPDFYQYTISNQQRPWTADTAGMIMSMFVGAVRKHLPNAVFSMDISPWVAPNDGSDNGQQWYSHFDMTQFTFINTSGGSTQANNARIRGDMMTWAGVSKVTGKPIMADTGYGVNGSSAGPDPAWDTPANINARISDGVVSISQYNPASTWGTTIAGIRQQLGTPRSCP